MSSSGACTLGLSQEVTILFYFYYAKADMKISGHLKPKRKKKIAYSYHFPSFTSLWWMQTMLKVRKMALYEEEKFTMVGLLLCMIAIEMTSLMGYPSFPFFWVVNTRY